MKRRTRILAGLALVVALVAGAAVGLQYYPYDTGADVCFARNGVAVGDIGDCEEMGRRIAEITLSGSGEVDWLTACHNHCEEAEQCSFYFMFAEPSLTELSYLQGPPGYGCILFD